MLSDVFHLNHFLLIIHSITDYPLWSGMANLEYFWKFCMENLFFHFSYNLLPSEVKETINCNTSTFNMSDLKISIKHTGPQISILFHRVFCEYCETNTLPKLLNFFMQNHCCGYFKASFFKSSNHH